MLIKEEGGDKLLFEKKLGLSQDGNWRIIESTMQISHSSLYHHENIPFFPPLSIQVSY